MSYPNGMSREDIAPARNAAAVGDTPYADDRPLFIVGCPRSGTTLLRDLLRRVPNFICPEETHFYRWADPLRTPSSYFPHRNNKLLQKHRVIDGVGEEAFEAILERSRTKHELIRRYITVFAAAKGITGPYRWFEKTPQNVYGAPLMVQDFPNATFVHLVRNPLNVVASLTLGRQVKIPDMHGACNYWCESLQIMKTVQAAAPDRVLVVKYEDLVEDVPRLMGQILDRVGIAPIPQYKTDDAHPEQGLWKSTFSSAELDRIVNRCGKIATDYGYDLEAYIAQAQSG